jgi:uncharacterized membrane protein
MADQQSPPETPEGAAQDQPTAPRPVIQINDPQAAAQVAAQLIHAQTTSVQVVLPFPPPDWLAAYNDVLTNGADRVVSLTERQAEHRQWLERWGLIFAFVIVLVVLGGGIGLLAAGKSVGGLVALIAGVGSLAGLFIYRERRQRTRETDAPPASTQD